MFTLKVKMSPVTGPRALRLWLPVPPVCPLPVGTPCGAGVRCVDESEEVRVGGRVVRSQGVSLQHHHPLGCVCGMCRLLGASGLHGSGVWRDSGSGVMCD